MLKAMMVPERRSASSKPNQLLIQHNSIPPLLLFITLPERPLLYLSPVPQIHTDHMLNLPTLNSTPAFTRSSALLCVRSADVVRRGHVLHLDLSVTPSSLPLVGRDETMLMRSARRNRVNRVTR